MEVPGTGDHCSYATFDFENFEDESWEGQKINADDSNQNYDRMGIYAQLNTSQRPKAKQGKMEKSFFNIKVRLTQNVRMFSNNICLIIHLIVSVLFENKFLHRLHILNRNVPHPVRILLIVWKLIKLNKQLLW